MCLPQLVLLALLNSHVASSAGIQRIELERKLHSPPQTGDVRRQQGSLSSLFGATGFFAGQRTGFVIGEQLERKQRVAYMGQVALGRPVQQATLIFDTGSSDIWVEAHGGRYDPYASRTLAGYSPQEVTINYGIGAASGVYMAEEVCLDASTSKTICADLPILIAEKTRDLALLDDLRVDGLFGLGLEGISHSEYCFTKVLGQIFQHASFGLSLVGTSSGSSITFGELDAVLAAVEQSTGLTRDEAAQADVLRAEYFGEQTYIAGWWSIEARISVDAPRHTQRYGSWLACWRCVLVGTLFLSSLVSVWMMCTSGILARSALRAVAFVGAKAVFFLAIMFPQAHRACMIWQASQATSAELQEPAILDSGSTMLVVPYDEAHGLAHSLLGTFAVTHCKWESDMFLCDCDVAADAADIKVEIGGVDIILPAEAMFSEVPGEQLCYAGLQRTKTTPLILGDIFLRSVYLVHDIRDERVFAFPRSISPISAAGAESGVHAHSGAEGWLMLVLSGLLLLGSACLRASTFVGDKVEPMEGQLAYQRLADSSHSCAG